MADVYYNNFNPDPIPASAYRDGTLWNYKLGDYTPIIQVATANGWVVLPVSKEGSSFIVSSFVTEGRSAQGQFVGEQIGRDQIKLNSIVFPALYTHEWERVLQLLKIGVRTYFKYYDMSAGREIIRSLYPGDRTATIYAYAEYVLDGETCCRPQILTNCSVNLIDRGD